MSRAAYYTQPAEAVLGDTVICNRCGTCLADYADRCTAALDDACPGYLAIEGAVAAAEKAGGALTLAQVGVLKHALGVSEARRAPKTFFRSHFVTGEGSTDHPTCMELVEHGLMQRRAGGPLTGGDDLFIVTGRGEAVVRELLK